jgi:hypothetical protein
MSRIKEECIEFDEVRPVCTASEKGKIYKLVNKGKYRVRKVKVDKCLDLGNNRKCDFLMSIDGQDTDFVYFIELKGGALVDGVEQVLSTMELLKSEFDNYVQHVRIIGNRDVPGLKQHPQYKKLDRAVKETGGNIIYRTNKEYTETI